MRMLASNPPGFWSDASTCSGRTRLVADAARIKRMLARLCLVREEDEELMEPGDRYAVYQDREDGELWHHYVGVLDSMPSNETLIRGSLTFGSLLDCICTSEHDDEVAAAVGFLHDHRGFEDFLARLETLASSTSSSRSMRNIALALACSPVSVPYNYYGCEGKSMQQIESDYGYFVGLSERAAALKSRAEAALGEHVEPWGCEKW